MANASGEAGEREREIESERNDSVGIQRGVHVYLLL